MTIVIRVHHLETGRVERHELAGSFSMGSTPGCDVHLPWNNPWMPGQQIAMHIAVEGFDVRIASKEGISFDLDDAPIDLTFPHILRVGSRIRASNSFEIVFEQLPERPADIAALPPRFDRGAAAEFDRDVGRLEAARPPPPPDALEVSLDHCTRRDLPNLAAVLGLIQPTLAELEAALGIELPFHHPLPGHIEVKPGRGHGPLRMISASYDADDPLRSDLRRARHSHLTRFLIELASGHSAWHELIAAAPSAFKITPRKEDDGFYVGWTCPTGAPVADEVRGAFFRGLVTALRRIDTIRELRELLAARPPEVGIIVHDPGTLELVPPVQFGMLSRALDHGAYDLKTDFSDHSYLPSWFDDRVGAWRIFARVDPNDSTLRVIRVTPKLTRAC